MNVKLIDYSSVLYLCTCLYPLNPVCGARTDSTQLRWVCERGRIQAVLRWPIN